MINICIIATIVIYLVGMLLVGFVYSKSNEDSSDFYLGGRTMGPLVTAMSAEASDMSSWLLMGMPGLAYLTGIASPGWTAIGLAVGTWLNWLIVARRLRRYSANLDAITVPQFLSLRFHDQRNLLNALGAVIIIVFFIPYTASGFAACGKLFNSLFGVDYMAAMILSAVVIVGYTIMGGFRAVSTTDLIQSVVMSMALIAVLMYGVSVAGGWDVVLDNARSLPGYLTMLQATMRQTTPPPPTVCWTSRPRWHGVWATSACPTSCCASWPLRTKRSWCSAAALQACGWSLP